MRALAEEGEQLEGALPPGLTLASNGLLSGTPTTPGAHSFTLSATNLSSSCSGSRAYTLAIMPPCRPLMIYPSTLPNGATGAPYSETLEATGGREPYSFNVKGALPPGLSLSADGVLSGTPTRTGYFTFTLLARDAYGCAGSRAYSITIKREDIEIGAVPPAS